MNSPKGFMIYTEDWAGFTEDFTDEEIGAIFKALLIYFSSGEYTEFEDRGMKLFYKNAIRVIELDRGRYEEKCARNAYNVYRRWCKEKNETPLDYEEWYTTVYDRIRPNTKHTNTNPNPNPNPNPNTNANTNSNANANTKKTKFIPPSLEEVKRYALERKSSVDPEKFYQYYEAGSWHDKDGNPVKNWKQKLISWERGKDGKPDNTNRSSTDNGSGGLGSIRITEL